MTAKKEQDLDVVVPLVGQIEIAGCKAQVRRIRTRELILLTRIVSVGIGRNLHKIDFTSKDQVSQAAALLLMGLPDAADEVLRFLREIVVPIDPSDAPALSASLANPEIEDSMEIIRIIVEQEHDDALRLWGKGKALLEAQQKLSPTGR